MDFIDIQPPYIVFNHADSEDALAACRRAITELRRAIALDPANASAHRALGRALIESRDVEEAAAAKKPRRS